MIFCSNCKWRPTPPDVTVGDWEAMCSRGHLIKYTNINPGGHKVKLRLVRNASVCLERDITEHPTRFERILNAETL